MARKLRTWLPPVGSCLLLQAAILATGLVVHRWLEPSPPCCASPLVL